jgi:hypothetical protein
VSHVAPIAGFRHEAHLYRGASDFLEQIAPVVNLRESRRR